MLLQQASCDNIPDAGQSPANSGFSEISLIGAADSCTAVTRSCQWMAASPAGHHCKVHAGGRIYQLHQVAKPQRGCQRLQVHNIMWDDRTLAESTPAQRRGLLIHQQITWDNRVVVPNMLPSASSGDAVADMMVQCVNGLARLAVTLACYSKKR
jgi:hypothetical protein